MRYLFTIICSIVFMASVSGQEHDWALGFYGDVKLDDASYNASFGVQGKYDLSNRSSLQAQIHGRGDFIAVGADYLIHFLNKEKSNFNVFLGAGLSQDFYTYDFSVDGEDQVPIRRKANYTNGVGQVGLSYYFPEVDLSIFAGYKLKYQFKAEEIDPNYLMFGVRYHLW